MPLAQAVQKAAISIVVVCWNNLPELMRTVASVRSQDFENLELVIVDGGSDQAQCDFAKQHADVMHSGPDSGVYDAMNKGIDLATGQRILFLNSGDRFYTPQAVSQLMAGRASNAYDPDKTTLSGAAIYDYVHSTLSWVVEPIGAPHYALPHMSTAVPANILKNNKFDTRYRILGDLDLWARLNAAGLLDVVIVDATISEFEYGAGLSSMPKNNALKTVERMMMHHRSKQPVTNKFLIMTLITHLRIEIFSRLPINWRFAIWKRRHGWQRCDTTDI